MQPVLFEDAIALAGHGRFHYLLQLGCGSCTVTMIVSTLSTSYLLPSAVCDFSMSSRDKGLLSAISYFGMICSSHMWGYIADTRGRKRALIIGLVSDSICSIVASFVPIFWLFLVFRFFNGLLICSSSNVVYAYLGEFHSTKTRTQAIMTLGIFVSLGCAILTGLAWVTIVQSWSIEFPTFTFNSWRVFVIFSSIPGLLTALLLATCIPESPKFLLSQGREKEALQILRRIYSTNTGKSPESYTVTSVALEYSNQIKDSEENYSIISVIKDIWNQTMPLFVPPHLKNTILACLMHFAFYSTSLSFVQWLPHIFNELAVYSSAHPEGPSSNVCEAIIANNATIGSENITFPSLSDVNTMADNVTDITVQQPDCVVKINTEMFINSLIHGSVSGMFYLIVGYLVNFIGKKVLLYVKVTMAALCAIGLYFMLTSAGVLSLACLFSALIYSCIGVLNSIIVDIFPTHLRAMALSLSIMFGRVGTVIGSLLIGVLLNVNCSSVFFLLSAVIFAAGVLAFFLPNPKKTNF